MQLFPKVFWRETLGTRNPKETGWGEPGISRGHATRAQI